LIAGAEAAMRTRTSARPGGDTHAPFYANRSAADSRAHTWRDFADAGNGNILRCFCEVGADHKMSRTGRPGLGLGEKLTQKREAPAVVGPGLSCRGFTTILADRDVGT